MTSAPPPIHDYVTDVLAFHPSNSRTGTPDTRRPACEALAHIALTAVIDRLNYLLDTEAPDTDRPGIERVIELLEART